MAQTIKIKAILENARKIKALWKANPDFKMGNIALKDFITLYEASERLDTEYTRKRIQLTGLKNERDDKTRALRELLTRFRSGMSFHHGRESAEYAQSRAARKSRKKPRPPSG